MVNDVILVGGDWNHGILNDFPETLGNGIIIPTDEHIFQRDWNHQPVMIEPKSMKRYEKKSSHIKGMFRTIHLNVGSYIAIVRILIKGWMTIPHMQCFDHGTYEWVELNVWMRHGHTHIYVYIYNMIRFYPIYRFILIYHILWIKVDVWMGGWTSINHTCTSYIGLNYQGFHGFWPLAIFSIGVFKGCEIRKSHGEDASVQTGSWDIDSGLVLHFEVAAVTEAIFSKIFGRTIWLGFLDSLMDPKVPIGWSLIPLDGRWFLKRNTRIRKPPPWPVSVFFARLEWVIFLPELVKLLGLRQHWHHHLNMALSADFWWTKIFLSWTDLRAFYLAHILLLLMTFWLPQPKKQWNLKSSETFAFGDCRSLQRAQRGGLPLRQAWAAETSHLQGRAGCCATWPAWPAWPVVSTRRRRSPPSSWRLRTQLRKMAVQFSGRSLRSLPLW